MSILGIDISIWISVVSLIISILVCIFTFVFNIKTLKNYNNSIQPVLRCSFFKNKSQLFLSIKNVGKTEASNIIISDLILSPLVDEIGYKENNIFSNSFNLLPEEEVIGEIGHFIESVNVNLSTISPFLSFEIKYKNQNFFSKEVVLKKELLLNNYIFPELSVKTDLDAYKIQDYLMSIGNANTRLANYFDGNTLFQFDRLNVMPKFRFQEDIEKINKKRNRGRKYRLYK